MNKEPPTTMSSSSLPSTKSPSRLLSLTLELRCNIFEHLATDSTLSISHSRRAPQGEGGLGADFSQTLPISSESGQYVTIIHDESPDVDCPRAAYHVDGPAGRMLSVSPTFAADGLLALYKFGTFEMPDPASNRSYLPAPTMASKVRTVAMRSSDFKTGDWDRVFKLFTYFRNIERLKLIPYHPWGHLEIGYERCGMDKFKAYIDDWSRTFNARVSAEDIEFPHDRSPAQKRISDLYMARAKEGMPIAVSWSMERLAVLPSPVKGLKPRVCVDNVSLPKRP